MTGDRPPAGPAVSVCLLADRPELIEPVGRLRWREWGRAPEPEDPAFWVAAARQELGPIDTAGEGPMTVLATHVPR